jgi:hypothetical protein
MPDGHGGPSSAQYDPVYLHARREALIILAAWATCLVWSVTACITLGYGKAADDVAFILGVPDWVFWGVGVPWVSAGLFSIVFSLFFMAEDDLGEDAMEADAPPEQERRDD